MKAQGKRLRAIGICLRVQFRSFVVNPKHFKDQTFAIAKHFVITFKFLIKPSGIAILTVTSPIVINVYTRGLLAALKIDSFVLWLAKFKYQKTCL